MTLQSSLTTATLAVATLTGTARAQDLPQKALDLGAGWSLTRLDLDVTVLAEEGSLEIEGRAALRLDVERSRGPSLVINAREPLGRFERVDPPAGGEVSLDIRHPEFPSARIAAVRFAEPLTRGAEVEIGFRTKSTGSSRQYVVDASAAVASWTEIWCPIALPGPGESLSMKSAAVGRTRFLLPPGWTAVTNGERVERTETETGVTELWVVTEPVARSMAAGPFVFASYDTGRRPIGVYRLREQVEGNLAEAEAIDAILEAQEARFGPYPYGSYNVVEVPYSHGQFYASSEQGFIMVKPNGFGYRDGNLALFGHEVAHGWWGNKVGTGDPAGLVVGETLAQYSAVIAIEAIEGEEAATEFLRFSRPGYVINQSAKGYFELWHAGHDEPLAEVTSGSWDHTLSDAKGHWVYHMLRRRVGDEVFFDTLRGIIDDFAGRKLTLPALRERFVAAAPDAQLERFFAQWLDRKGAPILVLDWSDVGAGDAHAVEIDVEQAGEPYHLFLEVAVDSEAGTRVHTVEISERRTRVRLEAEGTPTGVRLDPAHRLLIWCEEYGPMPE